MLEIEAFGYFVIMETDMDITTLMFFPVRRGIRPIAAGPYVKA